MSNISNGIWEPTPVTRKHSHAKIKLMTTFLSWIFLNDKDTFTLEGGSENLLSFEVQMRNFKRRLSLV